MVEGVADDVFGDEAVEDVEDGLLVVGVELAELVDSVGEFGVGFVEWASGCVFDDEVVDGDVEGFGEADEGGDGGGEFSVFVSADALGVGADAGAEVGLGPVVFFSEFFDSFAEGHVVASWLVT